MWAGGTVDPMVGSPVRNVVAPGQVSRCGPVVRVDPMVGSTARNVVAHGKVFRCPMCAGGAIDPMVGSPGNVVAHGQVSQCAPVVSSRKAPKNYKLWLGTCGGVLFFLARCAVGINI
jgi:hypothetical protein